MFFDFATSCNYVALSLSTHTGCRMHILFCAIISSIFYVCDVIVLKICPYKVTNLQLWTKNFKWILLYMCSQLSDVTIQGSTHEPYFPSLGDGRVSSVYWQWLQLTDILLTELTITMSMVRILIAIARITYSLSFWCCFLPISISKNLIIIKKTTPTQRKRKYLRHSLKCDFGFYFRKWG